MDTLGISPESNGSQVDEYELIAQIKSGANWFYWVAGLSLVNSAISLFNGNWSFFAGLGVTQVIDGVISVADNSTGVMIVKVVAFLIEVFIAGIFIGCGVFANKFHQWAFIVGIILYILDGLLVLLLGALLPAGFHVFVLFFVVRGFLAARKLSAAMQPTSV
jgi:hypothetical protein